MMLWTMALMKHQITRTSFSTLHLELTLQLEILAGQLLPSLIPVSLAKLDLHIASQNEDGSVIYIALSDMVHAFLPSDLICSFSRDAYDLDEGDTVTLMVILEGQAFSMNVDKFINCQGVTATGEYKLTPREIDFCVILSY